MSALPRGDVLVLGPATDVAMLALVADETGRTPWPVTALTDTLPEAEQAAPLLAAGGHPPRRQDKGKGRPVAAALVPDGTPLAQGWEQVARAAGWALLVPSQR